MAVLLLSHETIRVTDAEVQTYYAAHPEKFPSATAQGSKPLQAGPRTTAPFQTVEAQARQLYLDDAFHAYLASAVARAKVVTANDTLSRIPLG